MASSLAPEASAPAAGLSAMKDYLLQLCRVLSPTKVSGSSHVEILQHHGLLVVIGRGQPEAPCSGEAILRNPWRDGTLPQVSQHPGTPNLHKPPDT